LPRTVNGAALAVVLDLAPEITEGELVEELTPVPRDRARARREAERFGVVPMSEEMREIEKCVGSIVERMARLEAP
jgi:hypothetical protein